jgi:ectoine hydroxylase-related dioxygenase (phytanoyl-CoA dioxygenase family)
MSQNQFAARLEAVIGPEQIETYRRDGVVVLRGVIDPDWVVRLREAAEEGMAHPGELGAELSDLRGEPGRFFHDTFVWRRLPACRDFVFSSVAPEIAGRLMESRKVNLIFDQWLIKEPGTLTRTPWHHDLPYWPVDGRQISTLWLALDPVDRSSGAVEYVKGSHLWGHRYLPASFSGSGQYTENLPPPPDIDAMRDDLDIACFELQPGDCTLHHGLTVHAAPGNAANDRRRRAYVTRWAGDDAVFHPRDGIQEMPPLPDLAPGSPLDSDLWPVVWRA